MAKKNNKNVGNPAHNIPIPRSYDPMAMEERIYKLEKSEGGGGGGSTTLSGLTDVDISTPSNGQVLAFDSTSQKWENTEAPSGSSVSVTQIQSTGTKIATITVDDTPTDLYAPTGGGGGNIIYARVTKQTNPTGWLIIDDANGTPIDIDTYMILSLVIEGDMSGQPPYYTSNLLACDTGNKVYATRIFNAFNGDPNQSQATYTYRVAYMPIPS